MWFFKRTPKEHEVRLIGRSWIVYSEMDHVVKLEFEVMSGGVDCVIYFEKFCIWQTPFQNEAISEDDKERIKRNIKEHLEAKSKTVIWE